MQLVEIHLCCLTCSLLYQYTHMTDITAHCQFVVFVLGTEDMAIRRRESVDYLETSEFFPFQMAWAGSVGRSAHGYILRARSQT